MQILRFAQHGTDGNVSDKFFEAHLGRCTASSASAILDFTQKGIEGSKRKLYRLEKVAEILSGIAAQDHFVSAPMKAGTFSEPAARTAYELEEGVMVEEVGMVVGDNERTGWSPDGLVNDPQGNLVGAIESKCPRTTTHLGWMDDAALEMALLESLHERSDSAIIATINESERRAKTGKSVNATIIPAQHLPQLYFAFMCCPPLQWIDFISRDGGMSNNPAMFGPILPRRYVQFTIRLHRAECEAQIAKMREATDKFLADVDATIERLKQRAPKVAEPDAAVQTPYDPLAISDEEIAWAQAGFLETK